MAEADDATNNSGAIAMESGAAQSNEKVGSKSQWYAEERKLNSAGAVKISRAERSKKGLKAEVKLTTAFVKKVSTISDDSAAGLIRDINEKINLTRFVEEIVSSLASAPLKLKDVEGATALCSAMHRSYEGFMEMLYPSLLKQYDQCCASDDKSDVVRRRVLLRWLTELYLVGLFPDQDPQVIVKIIRAVTRAGCPPGPLPDPLPDTFPPLPDQACMNLLAVTSLLKANGNELLLSDENGFPPSQITQRLNALFTAFVKGALARLKEERLALRKIRKRVDNEALKRGEVTQETSEALERREKACEELYQGAIFLCEFMGVKKPPSPEELREQEESQKESGEQAIVEKIELVSRRKDGDAEISFDAWVFGDEATRSFYEDLDDLVLVIPRMILERPDQALQPSVIKRLKAEDKTPSEEGGSVPEDADAEEKPQEQTEEGEANAGEEDIPTNPDVVQEVDGLNDEEGSDEIRIQVESVTRPVEDLMARLPNMLTVRAVDSFARDFAHFNSKSARKRLVQELYQVPWGKIELLPYYARLAATLSKLYTGIGRTLVDSVRSAFLRSTRDRRVGSRLNSRLRYSKYLGELVKFGLKCPELECPPAAAFRALRHTMEFFQGENIDMACAVVETCGRELFRTPRTHTEMAKLLETLQRHRTAKNLGSVYDAMVDNAYYHCIPPENLAIVNVSRRERPEIEKYVRYILIEKLGELDAATIQPPAKSSKTRDRDFSKQEMDAVMSLFRLPWIDQYDECEDAISRAVLASCKHRAGSLPLVCSVLSQVTKKYPRVGARVVDDLLESIALGIDRNDHKHNQLRIGQAKLLGFMLRDGLLTQAQYFDILFSILHRGHGKPPNFVQVDELKHIPSCSHSQAHLYHPAVPVVNDPPWNAFRVLLVCAALETAGDKVTNRAALNRLDVFVKYLERYVWNKSYFPIEAEFTMLDTLQALERLANPTSKHKQRRKGSKNPRASIQLVGRASDRQSAEDQVASLEGRGFQSMLSASTVIEEEDEEEEEEDEDDEDEQHDDEAEDDLSTTRDDAPVKKSPLFVKEDHEPSPEDLAFEAEFSKLMRETIEQSGKSNLGGSAIRGDNLAIPLNVLKKANELTQAAPVGGVTLQLLKRGPNRKVEVKPIVVPEETLLAKASGGEEGSRREMREKQEDLEIKRLTLKAAMATSNRLRDEPDLL